MNENEQTVVYTIGHSNKGLYEVIGMLRDAGITELVDVRSAPYSRYTPHFDREAFSQALEREGINYRFAGQHLGGRPSDPTCYRSGQLPTGKVDYLREVDYEEVAMRDWYKKAIERLIRIAEEAPTAIMCSEEDPLKCHRHHLIARTLREHDIKVEHLPRREEPQMSLFEL